MLSVYSVESLNEVYYIERLGWVGLLESTYPIYESQRLNFLIFVSKNCLRVYNSCLNERRTNLVL